MNAEGGCEFEFTAGVTYVECNQLEDEEDIREGLKALTDEEGAVGWQEYQKKREG